jgi:predicted PurR-regulated permease PerM
MTLRSSSLAILATVAFAAALYLGQEVLIPVALGLLVTSMLRPLVRGLARAGISPPVSATLVTVGFLGVVGAAGYFAAGPIQGLIRDAPKTFSAARGKIEKIRQPIKQVSQAVEKAQKEVTGGEQPQGQKAQSASASTGTSVPLLGRVFATTAGILSTLLQTIVIVFLVLATGDLLTRKLAIVLPKQATGTPEQTVDEAESVVRRYLVVTLLLSGGQGIVIALTFMLLGMPSPLLWGVLTFLLESLPYIGALIMVALITITANPAPSTCLHRYLDHTEQLDKPLCLWQRPAAESHRRPAHCGHWLVPLGSCGRIRGCAGSRRGQNLCPANQPGFAPGCGAW